MVLRQTVFAPSRALGVAVAPIALFGAFGACGGTHRPPPLSDETALPSASTSGATSELSPSEVAPTCNLGPNNGVCACVDQPLRIVPPTLYFVLDRSLSMNTDGKWSSVIAVLDHLVIQLGPRANIGAAVFPGQSGCEPGVEVFAPRRGDSPAGRVGPTSTGLYRTLVALPAAGGTPTAATLQALLPHIRTLGQLGKTVVILATDGGPNCNPEAACNADACQPNIEGASGCPPGGPVNCCATPSDGSTEASKACLDSQPTKQAVNAIAMLGVPVYVVGIPGSAPYASLLDLLAVAGNTGRPGEPKYYAVSTVDQAALQSALFQIAASVTNASCTLMLDSPPPDPNLVNVFFDDRPVAQTGPDGWTLAGQEVTLLRASCMQVQSGTVFDVRVVAGCPTVVR